MAAGACRGNSELRKYYISLVDMRNTRLIGRKSRDLLYAAAASRAAETTRRRDIFSPAPRRKMLPGAVATRRH